MVVTPVQKGPAGPAGANGAAGAAGSSGIANVSASGLLTLGYNASNQTITGSVPAVIPVPNGGTGATTLTGLLKGNGTGAVTAATAGTDYPGLGTSNTFAAGQTIEGSTVDGSSVLRVSTSDGGGYDIANFLADGNSVIRNLQVSFGVSAGGSLSLGPATQVNLSGDGAGNLNVSGGVTATTVSCNHFGSISGPVYLGVNNNSYSVSIYSTGHLVIGDPTYHPDNGVDALQVAGTLSTTGITSSGPVSASALTINGTYTNTIVVDGGGAIRHTYSGTDHRYTLSSYGTGEGLPSNCDGGALLLGTGGSYTAISGGGQGVAHLRLFVGDLTTPKLDIDPSSGVATFSGPVSAASLTTTGGATFGSNVVINGALSLNNIYLTGGCQAYGDGGGVLHLSTAGTDRLTIDYSGASRFAGPLSLFFVNTATTMGTVDLGLVTDSMTGKTLQWDVPGRNGNPPLSWHTPI